MTSHEDPPDDLDQNDEAIAVVPITDHIDLHCFRARDIPDVVESYLIAARDHGYTEVRLIHGRGSGVQRARVQSLLRRLPYVLDFGNAPAWLGGWGATIVHLRPLPPEKTEITADLGHSSR